MDADADPLKAGIIFIYQSVSLSPVWGQIWDADHTRPLGRDLRDPRCRASLSAVCCLGSLGDRHAGRRDRNRRQDRPPVRSVKKDSKAPIHMVSAFAARQRLVLGQVKVAEKSNEIIAIPKLLNMLVIAGAIVTIDAMGCQRDIAQRVIDKKADYVLALKGNQGRCARMWRFSSPNRRRRVSPIQRSAATPPSTAITVVSKPGPHRDP